MLNDFKAFVMKGNVIDMAVGIIIGGAFGKIVTSLVNDVIMPPLGMLMGGVSFIDLKMVLKDGVAESTDAAGAAIAAVPEVAIYYGNFIQTTVDFLIIAFAIFMMIRLFMNMRRKKEEVAVDAPPPAPTKEEQLLTEIRDLLKK
ncbi:MAG: large-conductance mechanosensitive channel protein MscL [Candidatus Kapaibacterium sp.]|jgi:large conductance mechanosensitive channel